jgi:hypothetical protein
MKLSAEAGMGTGSGDGHFRKCGSGALSRDGNTIHPTAQYPPCKVQSPSMRTDDNGKTFYREKDRVSSDGNKHVQGDLCYGQQALDKIVNWEGWTTAGDLKRRQFSALNGPPWNPVWLAASTLVPCRVAAFAFRRTRSPPRFGFAASRRARHSSPVFTSTSRATQLPWHSSVRPVPTWPRRSLGSCLCFALLLPISG